MSNKNDKLWPDELEWCFIDPVEPEDASEQKDSGFYDAEFGSLVLRVIVRLDGKFQPAFGNDYVEITDSGDTYDQLDSAKYAACLLGAAFLTDGSRQLLDFAGKIEPDAARLFAQSVEGARLAIQVAALEPSSLASLDEGRFDVFDPVDIADCVVLQSMLALVDRAVPIEVIEKWTAEERKAAQDWAGASHLCASDNDDVVVPPEPEHVKANAKRVELDWP